LREGRAEVDLARGRGDFDFAQERVVAEDRVDEGGGGAVEEDAVAAANHHPVVIQRRVGETEAGREVIVIGVDGGIVARSRRDVERGV
jgi:hypothetical protein